MAVSTELNLHSSDSPKWTGWDCAILCFCANASQLCIACHISHNSYRVLSGRSVSASARFTVLDASLFLAHGTSRLVKSSLFSADCTKRMRTSFVRGSIYGSPDRLTLVRTMTTVTVSSKFQVVIPEDVRSKLKLQPGQKVIVIEKDGVVHMIPLKPVKETRGIARGITGQNVREELDRF